jgi:hypothetical protein
VIKWAALVLLLVGCKDKQPAPKATESTPPVTSAPPTPAPAPPAKPAALGPPISVEEAREALPKLDGTVVIELKQTTDKRQVHGTWCIAGSSADDVAKTVGQAMSAAGYTALSIRGDARKSGVSGDRGNVRMSMIVGSSGATTCSAPTHYFASATLFHP